MGVGALRKRFPQTIKLDFKLTRGGLQSLAPDIRLLADREGLTGHRQSVDLRLEDDRQQGSIS